MAWGRMDDGFDDHPKVVALLNEDDQLAAGAAIGLWALAFSWVHRNTRKKGKVPGLVPPGLPRRFLGPIGKALAEQLVEHGLWDPHESGGWLFHDFGDYLPTDETREARSAAGKRGAAKRWASKHAAEDVKDAPTSDGNLPSVCHDDDGKPVANDGSRAPARRAISKEIAPTPTPNPDMRSADADAPALFEEPAKKAETANQRVNRITKIYTDKVKLSTFVAVQQIVKDALNCGDYAEDQVVAGLAQLTESRATVTKNTLRHAIEGTMPWPTNTPARVQSGPGAVPNPRQSGSLARQSTGTQRMEQALRVAEELDRQYANGGNS